MTDKEKEKLLYMIAEYYPILWDDNRIKQLFEAKLLTEEEYTEITGAQIQEYGSGEAPAMSLPQMEVNLPE